MAQENNEASWFEKFKKSREVLFSEKSFKKYKKWVEEELKIYGEFIPKNGKILETGCGLGMTLVSLSALGYDVTGIDNDKEVVKVTKENAKNFGKKIEIIEEEIKNIDKRFEKDSFDVCISGGVIEHFPEEEIKEIIKKQLQIAPIVIASMPIADKEDMRDSYKDYDKRICQDGIYRNLWTPNNWINNILKDFKILKHHVWSTNPTFGPYDELIVVIGRH